MAHREQRAFCRKVKRLFPQYFKNSRVLEIGSRNVNGSLRELFADCEYIGVDCVDGDGVDIVCLAHEFRDKPESFDVVCAAETFEHDPFAGRSVQTMLAHLRPKGLFFMTCASSGRKEHGTIRQGEDYGPNPEFYRNVEMNRFVQWLLATDYSLQDLHLEYRQHPGDLYCYAIKN